LEACGRYPGNNGSRQVCHVSSGSGGYFPRWQTWTFFSSNSGSCLVYMQVSLLDLSLSMADGDQPARPNPFFLQT
jgi:hypothetical protein